MTPAWALVADPGIDDAVALAALCGLGHPPALVVAVPGNVAGATAARNAAGLVVWLAPGCPVRSLGADAPAAAKPGRGAPHGDDGLGGQAHRLPVGARPAPLDPAEAPDALLVTGALTAAAALAEAGARLERVVWMGGALGAGNVTPDAEFNAWCDPAAVATVLRAHPGTAVVPLDVTAQVVLGDDDLARLDRGAVGSLLADALRSRPRALVHDAVAAVAWLHPELFAWEHLAVSCDTTTAGRGRLVVAGAGPTPVATGVDAAAVRELVVRGVLACG